MRRGGEVYQVYERAAKLLRRRRRNPYRMADWHKGNNGADTLQGDSRLLSKPDRRAGRDRAAMPRKRLRCGDCRLPALIDQNPDGTDEYLWAIAECYESSGRLKLAIQTFRQVDRFPDNYFRMASCHRRLMEYNEALVLYNQCKVHDGAAPNAFIQIAYTYEEAGQREKAIKAFQLTCKSHPKSGQASEAHSHLQSKYNISVTLGGAKEE
ncbi:MAG: tetratricopeptide repeat protein [Verrucomicrobiales bacterium]